MADATELQNERALEEVFESAVEVASGKLQLLVHETMAV